jgi:hypothetical protein
MHEQAERVEPALRAAALVREFPGDLFPAVADGVFRSTMNCVTPPWRSSSLRGEVRANRFIMCARWA